MSFESVMSSNHLILCRPFSFCLQSFPEQGSFLISQLYTSGSQSIGASASASVLPMNIQDWFLLGLTGLIFLLSKGLSCGYILLLKYNQDNLSLATCKPHWRLKNLVLSDSIVPLMGILKLLWNFMNIYSLLCYILQWKTGKGDEQLSQN